MIETSCASGQHWPGDYGCTLTDSARASSRNVEALICEENGSGGGGGSFYEIPPIYIGENENIGIGGGGGSVYIPPSGSTHPNLPAELTDLSAGLAGLSTSDQIDYLLGQSILSINQFDWLSAHPTEADKIVTFLLENNTIEGKEFAKLAIDTYMDNCEFDLNSYNYFIQQIPDYKARMTQLELQIYNAQPLAIQYRYLYNANEASNKAKELFPESSLYNFHNDKSDAFRHAYFHGLNTYYIGYDLSVLLGDAHEMETPNNLILEKVMDLFNNQKGREIAQNPSISMNGYGVIRLRIYNAILIGQLMHLFPLNIGGTINLNTQLIPTNKP
ncbi:MAG: hypothetical protein NDI80_10145 [Flavobacteriaceae bacterium]|nr:hypothetical protein [Flavobacteriaceae bacterium]